MPKICLGTRVVTLMKSLAENNDSSQAALLVEVTDDYDPIIQLQLSSGKSSYGCAISISSAASVFQGNDTAGINSGDVSSQALALGHLFLRDDSTDAISDNRDKDSQENQFKNLTVSFQYESDKITLVIYETVANGMKRSILRETLEPLGNSDNCLSYAFATGEIINKILQDTKELNIAKSHWQKTAEDLGKIQQETKDTLLANFTKLRNILVERHQAQIAELKEAHQAEKDAWIAESAAGAKKPPRRRITKEQGPAEELFPEEDVLALARGRKLDSNRDATDKTITSTRRRAVLSANEAVDMVKIRREGEQFEREQSEKRKRRREESRKESRKEKSLEESSDDGFALRRKQKSNSGRKRTKRNRREESYEESTSEKSSDDDIVLRRKEKSGTAKERTKRSRRKDIFEESTSEKSSDDSVMIRRKDKVMLNRKESNQRKPMLASSNDDLSDVTDDSFTRRRKSPSATSRRQQKQHERQRDQSKVNVASPEAERERPTKAQTQSADDASTTSTESGWVLK